MGKGDKEMKMKRVYSLGDGYYLCVRQLPEEIEKADKDSLIEIDGEVIRKKGMLKSIKAFEKFVNFTKAEISWTEYELNIMERINGVPRFCFSGRIYKDW